VFVSFISQSRKGERKMELTKITASRLLCRRGEKGRKKAAESLEGGRGEKKSTCSIKVLKKFSPSRKKG